MALAVPTELQDKAKDRPYRLSPNHQQDLRDVAHGVEETNAGICTKYLLDHDLGHEMVDEGDVHLLDAELWCDRYRVFTHPTVQTWRNRVARCRRALNRLREQDDHESPGILMVVYGPPDPSLRYWPDKSLRYLGELAPLAKYTAVTEAWRLKMVRRELVERAGHAAEGGEMVVDFTRVRDREAWLGRVVSREDAVREATGAYPEPRPARMSGEPLERHQARAKAWEDRHAGYEARRASWQVEAREGACAMLSAASRAYWKAWSEVATS